ncbi:MAG: DUF1211 domain-containing protein [Armatimonadetes bacterium]|nr:DUF1211 domain-containing protein [Armatimonadota bacterium]
MTKGRIEAFSDAVIAIDITILVLELRAPHEASLAALLPLAPKFLGFVLSFVYLAIYWNNHHHMFQSVHHVRGNVLWANNHLLFWLSLVAFTTAWMGETGFAPLPVATYGFVLLMASVAYYVLTKSLVAANGKDSPVAVALGRDVKGKLSTAVYLVSLPLAFALPWASCALYGLVAAIWLVPDKRFERGPHGSEEAR